jgi:hypothetical protein
VDTATFREVQGLRQWWLWALLVISAVGTVGVFAWGIYVQIIEGRPWGDNPMSDTGLIVTGTIVSSLTVGVVALILAARLITEVRPDGIYVRFYPIRWNVIPYDTIASYQPTTYRAIRDYGGWGIRWGREGKAYIAGGDEGLQLLLNDGKKLLIGTRRMPEFLAAVRTWKR